jgi:hypothetical protein
MNTTPNTVPTSTTDIDRLARRRVGARLGWLTHASVYLMVMGGLTALALWQGRHPPVAAAFGWGLGLAIHGLRVFVAGKGSALRERLVDAERQRLTADRSA